MANAMYNVELLLDGMRGCTGNKCYPNLYKNQATAKAKSEAAKIENRDYQIYITFYMEKDGQHGYLNPTGEHWIEGENWNIPRYQTVKEVKYQGIVKDQLNTLDTRKTKLYSTYKDAHDAAEKLCKRTMESRGTIEVVEK